MLVKIKKNIMGGYGLGELDNGKKILVKKTLAGDLIDAHILKEKKDYALGAVKKIVEKSPIRFKPLCKYFEFCGGCDFQNCQYSDQILIKNTIIKEILRKNSIEKTAEKIIPASDKNFFYRNSIRFMFKVDKNNKLHIARHSYADKNGLIIIDKCLLQSDLSNKIANDLLEFINTNIDEKKSFWQLKIREGKRTGNVMIEIITSSDDLPGEKGIIDTLKKTDNVKSIYHVIAPAKSLIKLRRRLIFGSPVIYEKIGPYTFQISPESFFQANSEGVKTLYDKVKEFANIQIGDNLIDLYCGTGTIAIYLSTLAKKIVAVESVPGAIRDANDNAKINKISNINFICKNAENFKFNSKEKPIIIVDPPRAGLTNKLIKKLLESNFKKLIYISCNPATFVRDIKLLQDNNLKIEIIQPIDLFPQTHHIEVLAVIHR